MSLLASFDVLHFFENFLLWGIGIVITLFVISVLVFLVFHVLMAIGLYTLVKRSSRHDLAWLAWVPIVNTFLITLLVEEDAHESVRGKLTIVYLIVIVGGFLFSGFLPFLTVLPFAVLMYAFYLLLQKYSKNAIIHTAIAVVTGSLGMSISLFMVRHRTEAQANQ